MSIEVKIPEVGESITEVQIGQWLKAEGETVAQNEPLVVIESEKTTLELPSPQSGKLAKILHQSGDVVAVGESIAQLEAGEIAAAPHTSSDKSAAPAERPAKDLKKTSRDATERTGRIATKPKPAERKQRADEGAEKAERSVAVESRQGVSSDTGTPVKSASPEKESGSPEKAAEQEPDSDGDRSSVLLRSERESKPSAPAAVSTARESDAGGSSGSSEEEEVVPMTMLRRTAARRLVEAKQQMAMLTTFNEMDMSAVQALRREYQDAFEKRHQIKLGLMSFFVKAAVDALKQFPQLNAMVRGTDIVYHKYFNIGVAIAANRGLVVPVVRRADQLGFAEVERAIGDFAQRAKEGTLKPDELSGATFTITNGGVFGSLLSTPLINPPQSGILGMHTIQERPVAVQGQVVVRPMMYVALTYDHRIVDGREAVLFTRRMKEAIETPSRMLLEV